jgi:hypothetical protein
MSHETIHAFTMRKLGRTPKTLVELRDSLWWEQYEAITEAIDASDDPNDPCWQDLEDAEDERCEACGKFWDDDTDPHADWCRWSPRLMS